MKTRFYWLLLILGLAANASAQFQMQSNPAKNWQNQSIEQDSVYGTSSDKALELLKGRKSTTIIVAVIDGGVQINHPALKQNIWVNTKEIADNKIDDDHNGYVDDVHGWDFIGGKDSDVKQENLEVTRLYRDLGKKYASITADKVAKEDMPEYNKYLKVKKDFEGRYNATKQQYDGLKGFIDTVGMVKIALGKKDFNKEDLDAYNPTDSAMVRAKRRIVRNFKRFQMFVKGVTADSIIKILQPGLEHISVSLNYQLNVNFNPRFVVGDNYPDATQRDYGNNDVIGPTDAHGTHVSGIIAGQRTGKAGEQEGIADNVKILVVRVVPDGDERDKDVANGIRYAVDNGAKVINMSFGKGYSYNKKTVDDAVKYAEDHDVLLVHAAGNDHSNNDSVDNFPTRKFENSKKEAQNWIEVGASDVKGRPGSFSNYGKKSVDLFAPGVKIYSSVPDTAYAYYNGTSMASPCVAGVATIIREYFPSLTAKQVRKILMKSVTKPAFKVAMPGHSDKMVSYSDLCISGGIVNTQKAIQLAIKKAGK
ncbi:MAG TPA: S8 family serine peptidase [Bacteroidia bacterium]|nr:S8 family serine peptidase [Bacteroidia bacterium]